MDNRGEFRGTQGHLFFDLKVTLVFIMWRSHDILYNFFQILIKKNLRLSMSSTIFNVMNAHAQCLLFYIYELILLYCLPL